MTLQEENTKILMRNHKYNLKIDWEIVRKKKLKGVKV